MERDDDEVVRKTSPETAVSLIHRFLFVHLLFSSAFVPSPPAFPSSIDRPTYTFSRSSRSLFFIGRLPRTQTSSTRPRKTFRLSRRVKTESCALTPAYVYITRFAFYQNYARGTFVTLAHGKMGALLIYISTKGCESETLDGSGYFIDISALLFTIVNYSRIMCKIWRSLWIRVSIGRRAGEIKVDGFTYVLIK